MSNDVENSKSVERKTKPVVKGPLNGNVFAVIGATTKAMKRAGDREGATECTRRCLAAHSYDDVLVIVQEYVDFEL